MTMKSETTKVKGTMEIEGETCFYKMSVGTTDLYKAESGKEYVINPSFGVISIGDLLRWTSCHSE